MTLALIEPPLDEWDDFAARHPHGSLLQMGAWATLKATTGWRALRVAVAMRAPQHPAEPAGAAGTSRRTLCCGAQLLVRQHYGLSMAYVPRGPLLSGNEHADTLLLHGLERVARRRRAVFLRLEPPLLEQTPDADRTHAWLLRRSLCAVRPIQPRSTIHVDLAPLPDQLFARFSKGHRADIRRAERSGATVRVGTIADVDTFYAILESTGQRAHFGIHSHTYYRTLLEAAGPRARLLLGDIDGTTEAAHIVVAAAASGAYLYSGASPQGLKRGINHLLQWHALQWAHTQGCHHYDLWGIPDALGRAATLAALSDEDRAVLETEASNDPLIGVYRFKKGFGGTVVRYLPAYDQIIMPLLYRFWNRSSSERNRV